MHDVRTIVWLRWKQFRDDLVYGLRLLGYESGERLYAFYLAAILLFWAFAIGSYVLDQAVHIGRLISYSTVATGLEIIPILVLAGQVWVWVNSLRSTPLKLTFSDMAYVATSPVNPMAIALPDFLRQTLVRSLVLLPFGLVFMSILGAKAIGSNSPIFEILFFSLRSLIPGVIIVLLTGAVGWLLGMQRVVYPAVRRIPGQWLMPIALIPLALVWPDGMLYAGRLFVVSAFQPVALTEWLFLIGVTVVTVVGMLFFSQFINMTQAIDESQLFARIQALGIMAWRQPDLQMRVRMQSAVGGRQPWLRLPKNLHGGQAIVARAALSYIRHPVMLLSAAAWGAAMTYAALLIVRAGIPLQLVAAWVLVAGLVPPVGLLYVYRSDVEETFLRQFLPLDGFLLLLADAMLPIIAVCIGGMVVWLANAPDADTLLAGLMFIPIIVLIQTLGSAYGVARGEKALQTRLIAIMLSYGAIAFAYTAFHGTGLIAASALVIMILIGLVTQEG
jgi:hypothetical protein